MDQINFKLWCSVHYCTIYYIPVQDTWYTMYIHLSILHYTVSDCFDFWLSHYQGDKIQGVTHAIRLYTSIIRECNSCISSSTRYWGTRHKFVQYVSSSTVSCTWAGTMTTTWVSHSNENLYLYNMSNPLNCTALMMAQSGPKHVVKSII
jgi:hypothetical protein